MKHLGNRVNAIHAADSNQPTRLREMLGNHERRAAGDTL